MFLAGDIGGTKTHLALFSEKKEKIREKKFASKEHASLEEIVSTFLKNDRVDVACFGIAGPVRNGKVETTNLPWKIDASRFPMKHVFLLNDLEANAHGLFELEQTQLHCLQAGEKGAFNKALVSAGTGLGIAGIYYDGKKHAPFGSEGGHTDFAPRGEEEITLLRFLSRHYGHVSYERILSGPGIEALYSFLTKELSYEKIEEVERGEFSEKPRIISERALKKKCKTCEKTLSLFSSIYGAKAGNVALEFMALGGVYLGGGIAPKIRSYLEEGAFLKGFVEKGRFEALLKTVPVYIILEPETALLGAMRYAMKV